MIKNNLTNFGILIKHIPNDIFRKIVDECSNVTSTNHIRFSTGFNRDGSPEHYLVNQCKEDIKSFVLASASEYIEKFNSAIKLKLNSEGQTSDPEFKPGEPWINIQRKYQYIPNHDHAGFLSYSLWVKVPEPSKFEFVYTNIVGDIFRDQININKDNEGVMIMFPSKLVHCVYPFYNSNDVRISISGNLTLE